MRLWFYDTAREVRERLYACRERWAAREMASEAEDWIGGEWRCCVCRCPCLACEMADEEMPDDAWEWMTGREPVRFTFVDHVR
jgi:hypothetical protein